ncbi:MAG: hypothetical protein QXH27_04570 [Candidatus Micrarchaeia archaeon]
MPKRAKEELDRAVKAVFNEHAMVLLALLVIPILLAQLVLPLSTEQFFFLSLIEWAIWFAFLLEFAVLLAIARNKARFLAEDKPRTVFDLIVIISPLVGLLAVSYEQQGEFFVASLLRTLRATRTAVLLRPAAFAARGAYGVLKLFFSRKGRKH